MPKGRRKSKKDKAEEGAYKLKFSISGPDFSLSTVGTASAAFIAQGKIGFHAPGLGAQQQQGQVAGAEQQDENVGVGGATTQPEAAKGKAAEPLPEEREEEKEDEEVQPAPAPQIAPGSAVRSRHPLKAVQLKGALPPSSHVPPGVAVAKAALPSPPKTTPRCALPAAHAAAANAFDAASSNRASPSRSSPSSASTRPTPTPLPRSPARPPSQLTSSSARADCNFAARQSSPASPAGRLAPAAQPDSRQSTLSPASPSSPRIPAQSPLPSPPAQHAAWSCPSEPQPWLLPTAERDEYISLAIDASRAKLRDPSTKKPRRMFELEEMVQMPQRVQGRMDPGPEEQEQELDDSDDDMSSMDGEEALERRFKVDFMARLTARVDADLLREEQEAQEREQEEREQEDREQEEREQEERKEVMRAQEEREQKEWAAHDRKEVEWEQEALEQDEWEQDVAEQDEHRDTREREQEKVQREDAATEAGAELALGIAALQAAAARPANLAYHMKLRDSLLAFKYAKEDPPTRSPPLATAPLPSSARDLWRTNVPPLILPPPVVTSSTIFGAQEGGKVKRRSRGPEVVAIKDTYSRDGVDYVAGVTNKGKDCEVQAKKVKGTAAAAVWNHQVDVANDLHRSARRARYVERGLYGPGGARALKPVGKTPWGPTSAAGLNKRAGSAVFTSGTPSAPASSARSPSGSAVTRAPPAPPPSTRPEAPPRKQPRKPLAPVVPPPRSFSLAPRAHGASTPYSSSPPFALTQRRATLPQNAAEQNRGRAGPRKRATSAPGDDKRAGKKRKKEVEARALEKKAKRRRSRGASTAADIEATGGGTDPIVEDEE